MGGTILSTLGTFLPFNTQLLFWIVFCVVIFGIYIPYQERKQKRDRGSRSSVSPAESRPGRGGKLSMLVRVLKWIVVGLVLYWELSTLLAFLIFAPLMGVGFAAIFFLPILLLTILTIALVVRSVRRSRRARAAERRESIPRRPAPRGEVRNTHDHILSTAPDVKEQLEQLDTLREAGLLTREEYRERRKRVLGGR